MENVLFTFLNGVMVYHRTPLTSGAIRDLNLRGHTTACGGVFTSDYLYGNIGEKMFLSNHEPTGKVMAEMSDIATKINTGADAVAAASSRIMDVSTESLAKIQSVNGKMRDGTEKLSLVIDKMLKVTTRADYEKTVRLTEQLVSSLERLAALEKDGLLERVMKAMQK